MLLALLAFQSIAAEVGDAAPPIKVTDWIKGGPINFESHGTNVIVLDFWATTCAPCRYSIPYLSDLQKRVRSRGVLIVGIASEPVERVKTYLSKLDAPVEYAMAIDSRQQTTDAYLKGVGSQELPHAFVINPEGKLVWHGNATVALDKVLDQLLAGTLNAESARRSIKAEELTREYFRIVNTGRTNARTAE